jgi:hypothetical protein
MTRHRSILALTFALLVLFSSSSFVVGVHLCGGHIQNAALFTKAEGCEMEKKLPPCHKQLSKPCCEDETIIHEGEDFKVSNTDITLSGTPSLDIELPSVIISEIIPSSPISRIRYYDYDPPSRGSDLTVSLQVFLI